ncbi:uncharacterized protein LOC129918162 [Episyrphus balteatus]|uniref:uncharacterized protein LOC129918162 n=1 Tax=Episyrphus balteatus TaxID=286459 RepID=UPI002484E38D|nr:uncharacterized protein LOC129918162 [Episyrphus balteatus]
MPQLAENGDAMIIFLNDPSENKEILKEVFNFCLKNSIINILAVFGDFSETKIAFTYKLTLPNFEIIKLRVGYRTSSYFPNRSRNFQGQQLRVVYGGTEPKIIFSKNKKGELIINGYVAHFLEALAKKHNITLIRSIINYTHTSNQLRELVRNGSVDISAAVTYPIKPFSQWTYPLEFINWCMMLPIEPSIPRYDIFLEVFRPETVLITMVTIILLSAILEISKLQAGRKTKLQGFIVNDNCLRGALGQPFIELRKAPLRIKLIYLQICLLGIIITTSYNSYLQTYVTSPPTVAKINSFDDLLKTNIKIIMLKEEFVELIKSDPRFGNKYLKIFYLEENFTRFVMKRDSLDTKLAYPVPQVKWVTVKEQQKMFTKPLFRQPEEMCFFDFFPANFPIDENSIFMDVINFLILEVQSSGLLEYWNRHCFNELIDSGRIKLEDLSGKKVDFVPMQADHLRLIWKGWSGGLFVASLCFLGEILIFRWKQRRVLKM